MDEDTNMKTPSQFYRSIRPEYFSDSSVSYEMELPREVLAYEIDKISTNQKQDQFETLCRRLAEKLIVPNLIPQVGPTGGGDGKTDSETYPVSSFVSERWFVPENGWDNDQKWAFAFSAKQDWKEKVKSDVEKIANTGRGYTRIYFITNQRPSSKQKKELQDSLELQWKIPIVILDGEWIIESIYNNNYIELAIDSLNLSDAFKKQKGNVGQKDAERIKRLQELENNIANPNRYFAYDFQLVEDALEAAILSRMLEKPRQEVEAKFDRALRFCEKINNEKQLVRIHYQKAWTYLNWYDDYPSFIAQFQKFKSFISKDSTMAEMELYVNLFNLLKTIKANGVFDFKNSNINVQQEQNDLMALLGSFADGKEKLTSALTAQTFRSILRLTDSLHKEIDYSGHLKDLAKQFEQCRGHIDFPFEQFRGLIENMGQLFPNSEDYDHLIDTIASVSEERHSEQAAGHIYLNRGGQKLQAELFKESIVYFGKAVLKLAKEETRYGMSLALRALGEAYRELDLLWASNNCYVTACSILFKSWFEDGVVNPRTLQCVRELLKNELFIGRIPSFLSWRELYQLLKAHLNENDESEDDIPEDIRNDACLAVRILHSSVSEGFSYLPQVFKKVGLTFSEDACYYKLGYTDILLHEDNGLDVSSEQELDGHFEKMANQPFIEQMLYPTNLVAEETVNFTSKILGCEFIVQLKNDKELILAAEAILAFLEAFFATSLSGIFPVSEKVFIQIEFDPNEPLIDFRPGKTSNNYYIKLNRFDFAPESHSLMWNKFIEFVGHILTRNFISEDIKTHLDNLFGKEEVNERLTLIWQHRKFSINVNGDEPNITFSDWVNESDSNFPNKRRAPINYLAAKQEIDTNNAGKSPLDQVSHSKRVVNSVVDIHSWDRAKWRAFGAAVFQNHLGIVLGFEDGDEAVKIFKDWIDRFGKVDENDMIRISLIRGINKDHPYWYRIPITGKQIVEQHSSDRLLYSTSQLHEMWPETPQNFDLVVNNYERFRKFILYPAKVIGRNSIQPYYEKGIVKHELFVRWAWEVGENDFDNAAIKHDDDPYVPSNIIDAPVLALLQRKKENAK